MIHFPYNTLYNGEYGEVF